MAMEGKNIGDLLNSKNIVGDGSLQVLHHRLKLQMVNGFVHIMGYNLLTYSKETIHQLIISIQM